MRRFTNHPYSFQKKIYLSMMDTFLYSKILAFPLLWDPVDWQKLKVKSLGLKSCSISFYKFYASVTWSDTNCPDTFLMWFIKIWLVLPRCQILDGSHWRGTSPFWLVPQFHIEVEIPCNILIRSQSNLTDCLTQNILVNCLHIVYKR